MYYFRQQLSNENKTKPRGLGPRAPRLTPTTRHLSLMAKERTDVRITFMQNLLCSGLAGFVSKTITAPIDVVKVRTQIGTWDTHSGFQRAVTQLYKVEGFRSFWKGNFVGCLRLLPYSTVQVVAFHRFKLALSDKHGRLKPWSAGVAGAGAGLAATVVMYPSDTIKTRLIAQHCHPALAIYTGITHTIMTIYREEGLLAFYRGISTSFLGVIPFSGATFLAYEVLDRVWTRKKGPQKQWMVALVNGCIAGSFAQTLTLPFDTLRKKLQAWSPTLPNQGGVDVPCASLKMAFRETLQKHGVLGLWRGCLANNIKIMPYTCLMFLTYEACKNVTLYHNGYTLCPLAGTPDPNVDQSRAPCIEDDAFTQEDIY